MLLAERPPIQIPWNFVDGESAVFFNDLEELEEKTAYYLAHPREAQTIAADGFDLYRRRHTAAARAAQLLAEVQESLHGP
jgi:spore maturation protein CgeB